MNKYRIIKREYPGGRILYHIQRRHWLCGYQDLVNFTGSMEYANDTFSTLNDAEAELLKYTHKVKETVCKEVCV